MVLLKVYNVFHLLEYFVMDQSFKRVFYMVNIDVFQVFKLLSPFRRNNFSLYKSNLYSHQCNCYCLPAAPVQSQAFPVRHRIPRPDLRHRFNREDPQRHRIPRHRIHRQPPRRHRTPRPDLRHYWHN